MPVCLLLGSGWWGLEKIIKLVYDLGIMLEIHYAKLSQKQAQNSMILNLYHENGTPHHLMTIHSATLMINPL